jgi:Aspartyl protease
LRYLLVQRNLDATATAAEAGAMLQKLLLCGRTALLLAFVWAVSLCAQDFHFTPEDSVMPFELHAGFLVVVSGRIGNLGGLKFILDTGSSYTAIDTALADRFHLARRPAKITNFDRDASVQWAELPQIRVGPLQASDVPVLVAKLADYSDFAEGVDGIIGLDLLGRSKRLFINYERHLLSWEFANGQERGNAVATSFAVPMMVQGARLQLVLDTGLRGILVYKDRLQKSLPQLPARGETLRVNFGRVQTWPQKLAGVRLFGPETVATIFLMDGPAGGEPAGVDGYLGIAALSAKRVEFDFVTNTFRWQ